MKTGTVLLSALLVAGCSSISWFGETDSGPATPPPSAAGDDQAVAALASCKQQAHAVIQRDARIDRDIGGARTVPGLNWRTDSELDLMDNMDEFGTRRRFDRIVGECMRQRGYGTPEKVDNP